MHRHSLLHTALFAITTLLVAPAFAGNSSQAPQQAQQQPDIAVQVSEEDVQNFADAHQQVMDVRKQYLSKAKNTEGKEKMSQLKLAMQKDMLEAVQDSGMDPKRYNQVARKAAQDKELQQRIEKELEQ